MQNYQVNFAGGVFIACFCILERGETLLETILLLSAVVIFACIVFNKLSNKIGIPTLIIFIALGMIFGSDGLFKIQFENFEFAEQICTVCLIFIMFYGGFNTNWQEARKVAGRAVLLSTFGVIITAALTGLFCHYVLKFDLYESLLVGAVLSSTDAASVFSVLRSRQLSLKYGTASLLELESGSNDPFSYMLTLFVLSLMKGGQTAGGVLELVFTQLVFGIGLAILIACLAVQFLKRFDFGNSNYDTIFVFAAAILAYALPVAVGGNGYLSVYIVGIVLGNCRIENKKSMVHFLDGVSSLMQMLIFFLLGLLAFPSHMPSLIIPSLLIAIFLTFIARPIAVSAMLAPFKAKLQQQALVSFAGLRGAASIVFAIIAMVGDAYTKNDVFHIVFCVVLISIGFQGTLLPWFAKKLDMIDTRYNVLKTFNDYSDENDIQFISLQIGEKHPWLNKLVKEISIVPDTLLVMLLRDDKSIIPNGDTQILLGDTLVLSAAGYNDDTNIHLSELQIDEDNKWCGKKLSEIELSDKALALMIRREDQIIIPNGDTIIEPCDTIVLNSHRMVNKVNKSNKERKEKLDKIEKRREEKKRRFLK